MESVRPKKHLGQHFLRNETIAQKIAGSLTGHGDYKTVIEIGPGTGVLSKYLFDSPSCKWIGVEIDKESVEYLKTHYPENSQNILESDFLKMDLSDLVANDNLAIIGNFPYNISSQILFKILENRHLVSEMVGMFQKEVAQRIVAGPGGKTPGILSILCQAFYDVEYLLTVDQNDFHPPPAVKSAVIRFKRNNTVSLDCDEKLFFRVVKTAFNQRRKTLRNALKSMNLKWESTIIAPLKGKRAEELKVEDYVLLVKSLQES